MKGAGHDPANVTESLRSIAREHLNHAVLSSIKEHVTINGTLDAPTAKALTDKSSEQIKQEISELLSKGLGELSMLYSEQSVHQLYDEFSTLFATAIENDTWTECFPGKLLFNVFCGKCLAQDTARIRQAYLDIAIKSHQDVLKDIFDCFQHFATVAGLQRES